MSEYRPSLVLRSVNLPEDMDEQLRHVAFRLKRPKSDLIRWCIARGMREVRIDTEADIERFNREIDAKQEWEISAERTAHRTDIGRMRAAAGEPG